MLPPYYHKPLVKVLADHGQDKNFLCERKIVELSPRAKRICRIFPLVSKTLEELFWGAKLWFVSLFEERKIPMVTVGHGRGFVYAFFQYLCLSFVSCRTHVMFDFLLNEKRRGICGLFDTIKMYIFKKAVTSAVVYGETDVDTFSTEYGLPHDKLIFHPFHITLEDYTFEIRDDGYIFAGGNGGRDYETLVEAVKDTKYPVFIATTLPEVVELARPFSHISVRGVTPNEFRQMLAACTIFVEAHDPKFFRTAGHQTFLNAMWMGKPIVLADRRSATGYLESEKDSLVSDAGDIRGLRQNIQRLLQDNALRQQLSDRAKLKGRCDRFGALNFMQSIYNMAIHTSCIKYGLDSNERLINTY